MGHTVYDGPLTIKQTCFLFYFGDILHCSFKIMFSKSLTYLCQLNEWLICFLCTLYCITVFEWIIFDICCYTSFSHTIHLMCNFLYFFTISCSLYHRDSFSALFAICFFLAFFWLPKFTLLALPGPRRRFLPRSLDLFQLNTHIFQDFATMRQPMRHFLHWAFLNFISKRRLGLLSGLFGLLNLIFYVNQLYFSCRWSDPKVVLDFLS